MEYQFKVNLPSMGKAGYPSSLNMRTMQVKELKDYVGILSQNGPQKLSELIEKLTDCKDPDSLTIGDRDYLVVMIRVNSGMSVLDMQYTCPSCESISSASYNLEQMPIRELDSGEPTTTRFGEYDIIGRPNLGMDEILASRLSSLIKDESEVRLQTLATQVRDIETFDLKLKKIKEILEYPAGYYGKLDAELRKFIHGPKWGEVTFECRKCGFRSPLNPIQLFAV